MTLNTNVGRNEYTATSSQTIFNYTFKIYDATDLDVFVTPAGQVCAPGDLNTNYTVLGVDAEGGGSITLATPATSGDLITIVSSIPSSRTTDYQNNGDFRPTTVNDDIDRAVSIAKQAIDKANRAVTFPDCQQSVTSLTMPNPIDSSFLKWKSDLSGLENHTFSAAGIQNDVSVETYAALRALTSSTYSDGQVIFVTDDGIAGQFVVKTGAVTDDSYTLIIFTDDSNRYAERSAPAPYVTDSTVSMIALPFSPGQHVTTTSYHSGWAARNQGAIGGGEYLIKTAAQAAADGDVVDEIATHTLVNGNIAILLNSGPANTCQYGAYCDGLTSDVLAVQAALFTGISTGIGTESPPGSVHLIDSPVLVVNQPIFGESARVDFNQSVFLLDSDITVFESAYDSGGGVLVTNIGTGFNSHNTFGVSFGGFTVKSNVGIVASPHMHIQDWHQETIIKDIFSKVSRTVLHSLNNFYCTFSRITTLTATVTPDARFIFEGPHNLNTFERLQAANSTVGYRFVNGVSASVMKSMSFEGMEIGLECLGDVLDLAIRDSYFENISDTYLKFGAPVNAFVLDNNYCNFINEPGSFLIDYLPGPRNNISILRTNRFESMVSDAQFFKTVDTGIGNNRIVFERKSDFVFDIDDLYVDQTHFPRASTVEQPMIASGLKANIVNNFALGDYAGRYTDGYTRANGFEWLDLTSTTLAIRTRLVFSDTQHIYVHLKVSSPSSTFVKGIFVGSVFYEYTPTGVTVTTALTATTVSGFLQINGTYGGTITAVTGEIRLT